MHQSHLEPLKDRLTVRQSQRRVFRMLVRLHKTQTTQEKDRMPHVSTLNFTHLPGTDWSRFFK